MKKFFFPLQNLMNFKEQILESERLVLGEMNAVLARLTEELARMLRERKERNELLIQESSNGILRYELAVHKNYLNALDFEIQQKYIQIDLQSEAIDRQTDKVRQAKMEVSTIEKLRERKQEEYRYQAMKADEQFIDEFVNNTGVSSF